MENHSRDLAVKLETVVPSLTEVADVVLKSLKTNFAEVTVEITDPPGCNPSNSCQRPVPENAIKIFGFNHYHLPVL